MDADIEQCDIDKAAACVFLEEAGGTTKHWAIVLEAEPNTFHVLDRIESKREAELMRDSIRCVLERILADHRVAHAGVIVLDAEANP